ncbi:hypothetical protein Dimus_006585 [Dionaea muscipula]
MIEVEVEKFADDSESRVADTGCVDATSQQIKKYVDETLKGGLVDKGYCGPGASVSLSDDPPLGFGRVQNELDNLEWKGPFVSGNLWNQGSQKRDTGEGLNLEGELNPCTMWSPCVNKQEGMVYTAWFPIDGFQYPLLSSAWKPSVWRLYFGTSSHHAVVVDYRMRTNLVRGVPHQCLFTKIGTFLARDWCLFYLLVYLLFMANEWSVSGFQGWAVGHSGSCEWFRLGG